MVVNRYLIDRPGIASLLKSSVIKLSTNVKPLLKGASNARGRLQFKFVGLHWKAILLKETITLLAKGKILLAQDAKFICHLKQAVLFRFVLGTDLKTPPSHTTAHTVPYTAVRTVMLFSNRGMATIQVCPFGRMASALVKTCADANLLKGH